MEIRKAKTQDLETIISIYDKAREFMTQTGNGGQWKNGYPTRELLQQDIQEGTCYICEDEGHISGVFCFFVGEEPTYQKIYKGKWLNNKPYGVIHRIAVSEHNKGVASFCIQWGLKQHPNMKIDTHPNNIPMQKTILKNGFTYCGIIHKEDGTTRLAYQKTI